jgi:hypothetical protein
MSSPRPRDVPLCEMMPETIASFRADLTATGVAASGDKEPGGGAVPWLARADEIAGGEASEPGGYGHERGAAHREPVE